MSAAFCGARDLLKAGGLLVLTIPYDLDRDRDREHFPDLHRWAVSPDADGRQTLVNQTIDGRIQTYRDLVFHGGNGLTLEMRRFSLGWILDELNQAGFHSIQVEDASHAEFGIHWINPWSLPITARA